MNSGAGFFMKYDFFVVCGAAGRFLVLTWTCLPLACLLFHLPGGTGLGMGLARACWHLRPMHRTSEGPCKGARRTLR